MKRISNIYKKLLAAALVACGMTSCTDYLTIIPPEVITEEHFWQSKEDVNGVLAKAYLNMLSTDAVEKAIVWGELRADNLTFRESGPDNIRYIVQANLLDENSYCDWAIYYEAIQTANLVIDRAPQVVERDPDFSEGDLNVVLGEMYALRALGHFYLLRAFRDIPLAREVVADDNNMPEYPQVHPLEALDFIMTDLEKAEKLVMKSGNYSSPEQNYGRITLNAVLAMKADVNLWRAAFATYYQQMPEQDEETAELLAGVDVQKYYDDCISDCRDVISNMDQLYEQSFEGMNNSERYPYNLIQNMGTEEAKKDYYSSAYDDIFGTKNSRESIFEFQISGENAKGPAKGAYNMYGSEDNHNCNLVVPSTLLSKFEEDDLRRYSYIDAPEASADDKSYYVAKYSAKSSPATDFRKGDEYDANWIVYRKTDVLLMMAEALVERSAATEDDYAEAVGIVRAINVRSRVDTTKMENPIEVDDYKPFDRTQISDLILNERLLELTFEGKRWFDLVRKALREGTTANIRFVADKLDKDADAVKTKLSTIDGLFMPIYIDELRFNKLLEQNPVYGKEDSSTEMN